MSDAIEPQAAINKDGSVGMLVDQINRDRDVCYRRFKANWLRALPIDDEDEDACGRYTIATSPT